MSYTYYGDLLGISGYYRLSPHRAYSRLNDFYNTTFDSLSNYCRRRGNAVEVNMFSDSILIWGDNEEEILRELQGLYSVLIRIGLLLRGAVVRGSLQIDPRITLKNFQKMLPKDDLLARAVGLEQTQKGARLLIENSLAEDLLENHQEWLTQEGYLQSLKPTLSLDSVLRRISPTPDNKTYELLYLWPRRDSQNAEHVSANILDRLTELSSLFTGEISTHYEETLKLYERSKKRREFTERQIDPSFNAEIERRLNRVTTANNSSE